MNRFVSIFFAETITGFTEFEEDVKTIRFCLFSRKYSTGDFMQSEFTNSYIFSVDYNGKNLFSDFSLKI